MSSAKWRPFCLGLNVFLWFLPGVNEFNVNNYIYINKNMHACMSVTEKRHLLGLLLRLNHASIISLFCIDWSPMSINFPRNEKCPNPCLPTHNTHVYIRCYHVWTCWISNEIDLIIFQKSYAYVKGVVLSEIKHGCQLPGVASHMVRILPRYEGNRITDTLRTILPRNSNSMETWLCSHSNSDIMMATNFCTSHDSRAVVACAKFCSGLVANNGLIITQIFHLIFNYERNIFSEMDSIDTPLPTGTYQPWLLHLYVNNNINFITINYIFYVSVV